MMMTTVIVMMMPEELHDGEDDDADGEKDGEEDPVEKVEETKIGPAIHHKAALRKADHENSVKFNFSGNTGFFLTAPSPLPPR